MTAATNTASVGLDWNSPSSELSSHSRFILDTDWQSTPIGAPPQWPPELHRIVSFIMKDPNPAAVLWGDDLTMIYNEAFVDFAGSKHPKLMGSSPKTAYPEVWDSFQGIFDLGRLEGKPTRHTNVCLFLERYGYLEECYVTYTFVPVLGYDGTVCCIHHTVIETTQQILTTRRTSMLLAIGDRTSTATSMKDFWARTLAAFESNVQDAPFVLVYAFDTPIDNDSASALSDGSTQTTPGGVRIASLEGTIGLPVSQVPIQLDTKDEQDRFILMLKKALRTGDAIIVNKQDATFPGWMSTRLPGRGFDDECTAAVILPIRPIALNDADGSNVVGFLIVGLNPRRPYDADYRRFIHLWLRQLATSAASVTLIEQQICRQIHLSEQLKAQRRRAQEVEARLTRFAGLTPIAMWILKPTGEVIYANRAWYDMMRGYYNIEEPFSYWNALAEQDETRIRKEWASLLKEKKPTAFENRLKHDCVLNNPLTGEKVKAATWVIASAHPELNEDGEVTAIYGCSTDVSHQKWMEGLKEQRLKDVLEMKRESENFIDMTSHEMRNPLSAILLSAEGIATSLDEARQLTCQKRSSSSSIVLDGTSLECITDSAEIITICAQHQKRIIDDVLTLSKLGARLLVLTPDRVRPTETIKHTLKILELEMQSAKIKCNLQIDPSYYNMHVDWVMLDPCRLIQVLINLLTNAIKFTRNEHLRIIILSISASKQDFKTKLEAMTFFDVAGERPDPTQAAEWGTGDCIYLKFAVQDTGKGLSPHEQAGLFSKFSQATHRTHIEYGGSGLGLFISKELTELHGGQIGVSSDLGVGSIFSFYIKARKADGPLLVTPTESEVETYFPQDTPTEEMANTQLPSGAANSQDPKIIHVLIVEDNLINQRVFARQLRKAGCIVHVANHGQEALQFLQTTALNRDLPAPIDPIPISIILMDLEMPVMDGLTCVCEIRRLQKTKKLRKGVPIFAVTANARLEQLNKAKEQGVDEVVTKPFRVPELMDRMQRAL